MAKKFAAINGLHSVFNKKTILVPVIDPSTGTEIQVERTVYDPADIISERANFVNHNTVCFVTADTEDAGSDYYITDHKIQLNDRFIIVQNDVFSLYGSLETNIDIPTPPEPTENTWRPIYLNGYPATQTDLGDNPAVGDRDSYTYQEGSTGITVRRELQADESYIYIKTVDYEDYPAELEDFEYAREKAIEQYVPTYPEEPFNLDFTSGNEYIKMHAGYSEETQSGSSESLKKLSLYYDFDMDAALAYIQEHIIFPTPETPSQEPVNDGELEFGFKKSTVHTDKKTSHDIEINQNTLGVESVKEGASEEEEPTEIEGNFSANTPDKTKVKIHYKGTADRVDWYIDSENRDENELPNNSTAKKHVFVSPLQKFFDQNEFPSVNSIKDISIISPDSIVFIECGKMVSPTDPTKYITDAELFENPEYQEGSRWIWTQGRMYSCNTWMPIFTRKTYSENLIPVNPIIGNDRRGTAGRLIIEGKGGVIVTSDGGNGTDKVITIDGSNISREGGGGTVNITAGDGIRIDENSGGDQVISAVAKQKATTKESQVEQSGKNFLHIKTNPENPEDTWLEVNGVDSRAIIIEEDIPIGNTIVGENVISSGTFHEFGDKIPAGMTLHEVLYRILYREVQETWGTQTGPTATLTNTSSYSITATLEDGTTPVSSGSSLPVGTKIIITVAINKNASQSVKITGYVGGYQVGDPGTPVTGATQYQKSFTPVKTVESDLNHTTAQSGFITDSLPATNKIKLIVGAGGTNSITFGNKVTASSEDFTAYTVYPISNIGNVNLSTGKEIKKSLFTNSIKNLSQAFTIVPILPYYIGAVSDFASVHDFSSGTGHDTFITSHVGSGATSTIKFEQYNTAVPSTISALTPANILTDAVQFILAVPKSTVQTNWIDYMKDSDQEDWLEGNAGFNSNYDKITPKYGDLISINGVEYNVFTLTGKRASKMFLSGDIFEIKINK